MLAGAIGLVVLPPRFTLSRAYWRAFALYGLSRLCEHWDAPIFAATGWISGHTLKHLLSALAVWVLADMLRRRVFRGPA